MFTGIVQGIATVRSITDRPGLRSFTLSFPPGFCDGPGGGLGDGLANTLANSLANTLAIGASVAVDGVCLTVTSLPGADAASFDVMQQSLSLSTLGGLREGSRINVERAARDGAEIGGHPLSGHVDFIATVAEVRRPENNHVLKIAVPAPWMRYIFAKGYIAVNGASLTVAEAQRQADGSGSFEVWLIPESLRMTTFGEKAEGAQLHIEIERQTQVFVDTVRAAIDERLGPLLPALQRLLAEQGSSVDELARPAALPRAS